MNMQISDCAEGRVVEQRPPVLLFTGRRGREEPNDLTRNTLSEVCDLVLAGRSQSETRSVSDDACIAFYSDWRDLEREYNSCSIGVIAATAPETDAVARIISEGIAGGPLPGAIALTGFDAAFADLCRRLSEIVQAPTSAAGRSAWAAKTTTPFEWPPMVVFLPMGDPDVLACAKACRALRANDVPISLEIVPSVQNIDPTSRWELCSELERFFAAHLMPVFPKLL